MLHLFLIFSYQHLKHQKWCNVVSITRIRTKPNFASFIIIIHGTRTEEKRSPIWTSVSRFVLFVLSIMVRQSIEQMHHSIQFSDMIRELTDCSIFPSKANEFGKTKDHFIQVRFHWAENLRYCGSNLPFSTKNLNYVLKMLDYNLSGGQRQLSNSCVKMYQDLIVNKEITTENIKQAHLLGWCMELVSSLLQKYVILWEENYELVLKILLQSCIIKSKCCVLLAIGRLSNNWWHTW